MARTAAPIIEYDSNSKPWSAEVKYLGIIFDQPLRWKTHIDQATSTVQKGINVMRAICRTWWGTEPGCLLNIYKGISSYIDYGSQILFKCNKQWLKKWTWCNTKHSD